MVTCEVTEFSNIKDLRPTYLLSYLPIYYISTHPGRKLVQRTLICAVQ